ncbi:pitrilysin family protein, partial [Pseudomonas sp. RTS4]
PNNATLVVVGDVQPDEVKALAQRYFGPIPRRETPPSKIPLELAEPGERLITLHVQTQLPSLIYGFNVPSMATAEDKSLVNALRLISALLDGGYSARIPSRLERGEELVASASSSYDAFSRGDSLFMISATPNLQKNKTLADVEAGIWRLLDELKTTPPTSAELERVQAQVVAALVFERDSISSQASTIGELESVGLSWKLIDQELDAIKHVTPADIQKAARTYFIRERLSVAHVLPEEKKHD